MFIRLCVKDEKSYKLKRPISLDRSLREVDYVILSPGVSLHNSRNKKKLIKHKSKIITDIDLLYLNNILNCIIII